MRLFLQHKEVQKQKYIPILKKTRLFTGIHDDELASILHCLHTRLRTYPKGSCIFSQGTRIADLAILAEGRLHIQNDDYWGNRSILGQIAPGEMFGEAYLAPDSGPLQNDVAAVEDSAVLFFEIRRLLTACSCACRFHTLVIQNLFFAISGKNQQLVQKLSHMSRRTTREKLISYLSEEARRQDSDHFEIPFNRQQLANFLSVDRSAMSNELSKMRGEGLLEFDRNRFRLLTSSYHL